MRELIVFVHGEKAGVLKELEKNKSYEFVYEPEYSGPPVSLTMPMIKTSYVYSQFPPFFDGLLPEGPQLEGLLLNRKLDRRDLMGQLAEVGEDLVGAVTVKGKKNA